MGKYEYEVMNDYGMVNIEADQFCIDNEILTFMDVKNGDSISKGVFKKWNYFTNKGEVISIPKS